MNRPHLNFTAECRPVRSLAAIFFGYLKVGETSLILLVPVIITKGVYILALKASLCDVITGATSCNMNTGAKPFSLVKVATEPF